MRVCDNGTRKSVALHTPVHVVHDTFKHIYIQYMYRTNLRLSITIPEYVVHVLVLRIYKYIVGRPLPLPCIVAQHISPSPEWPWIIDRPAHFISGQPEY